MLSAALDSAEAQPASTSAHVRSLRGANGFASEGLRVNSAASPAFRAASRASTSKSGPSQGGMSLMSVVMPTRVFDRNPDVIAEVLHQARGICGGCGKPAPFQRKSTGRPYLEVHHVLPLAQGGHDTVANAIALCPNCHREQHYG